MAGKVLVLTALLLVTSCKEEPQKPPVIKAITAPTTPLDSQSSPRRAIDVHAHVSPVAYQVLPEVMEANGVSRMVNLSGGSTDERLSKALEAAKPFRDKIAVFANIDWSVIQSPNFGDSSAENLRRHVRMGAAGLKISKHLGLGLAREEKLVPVDDSALDPVWKTAANLGIPVSIHTSDPKAFFEPMGPENERMAELSLAPNWSFYGDEWPTRQALLAARDRVLARHPETTFILVHVANNPEDIDYVDALLDRYPNANVDLSARIGEIGRHTAERMRAFMIKHRKRILFGTDIMLSAKPGPGGLYLSVTLGSISEKPPGLADIKRFYDGHWAYLETTGEPIDHPVPIQGDWKVNPLGLPADVLEDIYFGNAERLIFAPHLGRQAAALVSRRSQL